MNKFFKIFITLLTIILAEIFIIIFLKCNNYYSLISGNNNKNIILLVDLTTNTLNVFEKNILTKSYIIAAGKPSTPSPIGTWTIINKGTWGNGFGGRWMGLNVPWGKYGIHGTNKPNSIGWNSSHGCIRMRNKDINELYKITPHGTKVIIYGGPYGNFGNHLRIITPGMRGSDVYEVQKLLKGKGYYNGKPDGIYGEAMKSMVHKFQNDNNLPLKNSIDFSFYKKLGVEIIE